MYVHVAWVIAKQTPFELGFLFLFFVQNVRKPSSNKPGETRHIFSKAKSYYIVQPTWMKNDFGPELLLIAALTSHIHIYYARFWI